MAWILSAWLSCCDILTGLKAVQEIQQPAKSRIRKGLHAPERLGPQPVDIIGGLFFISEQVIHGDAQGGREVLKDLEGRKALARLPGGDRALRH